MTMNQVTYARIDFVANGFRSDNEVAKLTDREVLDLIEDFNNWLDSLMAD